MSREIVRLEIQDPVIKKVVNKIVSRSEVGFKKYGVTLADDNQSMKVRLIHYQEELMDACNYIEWIIQKLDEKN